MKKRFGSYECERVLLAILLGTAGVGGAHAVMVHAATVQTPTETENDQTNQQLENKILKQTTVQPTKTNQINPAQLTRSTTTGLSTYQTNFKVSYNESMKTAIITGSNNLNFTTLAIPDVVVNDGVTYRVVGIQDGAFANDPNLQSVILGANIRSLDANVFANDSNLKSVDFSKTTDFFSIGESAFANTGLQNVVLPDTIQQIYPSAFANCQQLTTINLPDSLYNIGAGAFKNNTALTEIQIPASLRAIADQTFAGDTVLNHVDFELGSQLTSIGNQAFANDTGLIIVQVPASVTSIGQESFYQCHSLNTVSFVANGQLTSIGNRAFAEDDLSFSLVLPNSLRTIGTGAFMGNQIEQLTLNNGLLTIGNSAFAYNRLAPSLTIPSSVTSIGMSGFEGNQLSSVSSGGPNLQIGPDAFSYNRLTNVTGGTVTNTGVASSNNNSTIYTNNKQITLADLFKLNLDGQTDLEKNLQITNLSSGVSYANGVFTVNGDTDDFSFDWTYNDHGVALYSGDYEVDADTAAIKDYNTVIMAGTKWVPEDNTTGAVEENGTVLTAPQLAYTVTNPQGNTVPYVGADNQLGPYQVNYMTPQYSLSDGQVAQDASDVNVNIIKRQATFVLSGTQLDTYNGKAAILDPSNYQVTLSNGDTYQLTNGDLTLANNQSGIGAGTYQVVLSNQGLANLAALDNNSYDWTASNTGDASLQIAKALQTITIMGSMSVPYNGQVQAPTAGTFTVVLSNGENSWTLQPSDLVTTSGQPLQNAGQYQLTLSPTTWTNFLQTHDSADNQWQLVSANNSFTITPAVVTIAANNLSKYTGETDPTLTSTITDQTPVENGSPLNYSLSRVAGEAPGMYPISVTTGSNPNYQIASTTGSLTILVNHESLSGQNATMFAGDSLPEVSAFAATATNQAGQPATITVDLSQVNPQIPGTYAVTLQSSTGETKQVTLQVLANQQSLTGQNYTMYFGDPAPTIDSFQAQATDRSGQPLTPVLNLSQVNLTVPGTYPVTLTTSDGQQRQLQLTILANQQHLTGQNYQMYVNGVMPTVTDFQGRATNKSGQPESVTIDTSQVNLQVPGNYPVTLATSDGQKLVVTLQVMASQASLDGQDATMYVGDPLPTVDTFKATATNESGQNIAVNLNLSQVNLQTPGNYPVTLTATTGQTKVVTLHILANDTALSGQNYQMYVGDSAPTSADFQAKAVAEDGTKLSVSVDLSRVNFNQPGTYPVILSANNGQSKTVTLQLLANQSQLTGQNYQMYTNGLAPTAADFQATATNRSGQAESVQVDLSQTNLTVPGNYPVTLSTTDGQTKVVNLRVLANQQKISGQDFTIYAGNPTPTVNDFMGQASNESGQPISVTVNFMGADLQVPGNYPVTLTSSDGQSLVVTLHVLVNQQQLTAQNATMIVGDPEPTLSTFQAHATNEAGQSISINLNLSQANLQIAGSYPVTLSASDGQTTTVRLQILANQQSLTGSDATIYTNASQPTASTFQSLATNKYGTPISVQVDLSQAQLKTAGNYLIQLTTSDGQHKTVTLHVLADQQKILGQNATIYTSSPTPTSATFAASATAINGQPLPVQVDLSQADLHLAGTYPVLLTTSDGQSREVSLQVLANQQSINGHNAQIYVGDPQPTAATFAASAHNANGQSISVQADLSQANQQEPGNYPVTLTSSDGQTKVVVLSVLANEAQIHGIDATIYTNTPMPTLTDFQASATNREGQSIPVTLGLSQVNLQRPGNYSVTLSANNGLTKIVLLHVLLNQQEISGHNATIYLGNVLPTVNTFQAQAKNQAGQLLSVTANLTQVDPNKVGTYPVMLTASDGQTLMVQLTVLANQQQIHGQGVTMYTGDPLPTVADFQATATNESGQPIAVTVDLDQVNSHQAGIYPVVLRASDGQTLTVSLKVLVNQANLTAKSYTMILGGPRPTLTDFQVVATDQAGIAGEPVQIDFSQVNFQKVGLYRVYLQAESGREITVDLTIVAPKTTNTTARTTKPANHATQTVVNHQHRPINSSAVSVKRLSATSSRASAVRKHQPINRSQGQLPTGKLPQTNDRGNNQLTIWGVLMSGILALAGALGFKRKKQKK